MGSRDPDPVVAIGRFKLEPHRRLLDAGRTVDIGNKALDVLSVLARARGNLVTKDELMAAVWPGVTVEENAIQVHVSALRRALGGDAGLLVTMHGRGYRLDVDPVSSGDTTREPRAPALPSLAVLAFLNLTGDPDQDHIVEGLAEELIATLSRAGRVRVASRTSSFAYRGRDADVRAIARDLGVGAVLEGSVRAAGDRMRVSAQLIEASTGHHLWADSFDRVVDDVLAIQADLAIAISRALSATLGAAPPSPDPELLRLHLQARAMARTVKPPALLRAIDLHEQAIARDPAFARAWAGLAGTLMVATSTGALPITRRADARARAAEAIRLDPDASAPYAIRAVLDATAGRWTESEAGFRKAIELDPEEPTAQEALAFNLAAACGQLRRASDLTHRACELAPASEGFALTRAYHAFLGGDLDAAADRLDTAVMLGISEERSLVIFLRSEFARAEGRFTEAGNLIAAALAQAPPFRADIPAVAEQVYAAFDGRGDPAMASAAVEALAAATDADDALWRYPSHAGHLMTWLVLLGRVDAAYRVADRLEAAWRRSGHLATWSLHHLWRGDMRPFRQDGRFPGFVERLGLLSYWTNCGPPDGYHLADDRLSAVTS